MSPRVAAILCAPLFLTGCFLFNTTGEDGGPDGALGPDGAADGGWRDGAFPPDGEVECLSFGATRLCGEPCPLPCPWGFLCEPTVWQLCADRVDERDPRGLERCSASVRSGGNYCYSGDLCASYEATFDPVDDAYGLCVDPGYCEWIRDRGVGIQCRYSEGHPYVNGPPDVPCGTGALPESGFCGGRCGDTCAPDPISGAYTPACVGISEERGFGVCVPYTYRCATDLSLERTLAECRRRVAVLGAPGTTCACMLLSPPLLAEYAEHGWAVARQTCLAYQRHFPGQVRCLDETWTEL